MIDLHCHLLPGLDDGARDLEEAVAMATMAVADGIRGVVATPHYFRGGYMPQTAAVAAAAEELRAALGKAGVKLRLYCGMEAYLAPELASMAVAGEVLTLGESGRYLLVELPFAEVPIHAGYSLGRLLGKGFVPVLAHPERTAGLKVEVLRDWVEQGALVQLNAGSLGGVFGRSVKRFAWEILRAGLGHCVASDAHSARARLPRLSPARKLVAQVGGEEAAELLFAVNPALVVKGKDVGRVELCGKRMFGFLNN